MGRRKQKTVEVDQLDYSDDDSVDSGSTAISDHVLAHETESVDSQEFTLEKHLEALYEKRGSTREIALAGLVTAFEGHVLLDFIQDRCITLLHQYLGSLKRGSVKEACLSARAIGLLAITGGTGSNTHEIMGESTPPLSRVLISGPDAVRIFVLDSLAVVTFVGSNNWEETEAIMKVIWEIIHPKSRSKAVVVAKPSSATLVAALCAWSFLLTTLTGWRVDLDMWTEMISFLCNLLEKGDRAVRIAAGEAIAVIFEIVIAGKLSTETNDLENLEDVPSKPKWFVYLLSLKEKIISLVSVLAMEAGGKGTDKKCLNAQRDIFQKIYDYLMDGKLPETSLIVSKKQGVLTTSTWTKLIQLNFLKRFLGSGFLKHAQDNELLHNVFHLIPHAESNLSSSERRIARSSGDRMRTQELKKDRHLAQLRKGALLFNSPT
ncbi:interferon-related developmental regulator 2-like [Phalaenopsis equestris]|uniref:interferon-related developmental regulator 2-like n=1 Tax=Phalaenopsis equestris TaxID=78828 RepID=UPI0009E33604|nr:interferon-related developmental regulator 2-like [Phalaenopsis equestris]